MKTVSKKELEVKASKEFKKFPNAKQLHATVDGNIFLEKNRAELHSEDIIYTFDRPGDSNQKDSNSEGTNNDVNEKIDYRVAIKTIQVVSNPKNLKPQNTYTCVMFHQIDAVYIFF